MNHSYIRYAAKRRKRAIRKNFRGIKTEDARRHCIRSHSPRGCRNAFFIIPPYLPHSSGFSTDALANDVEKRNGLKVTAFLDRNSMLDFYPVEILNT